MGKEPENVARAAAQLRRLGRDELLAGWLGLLRRRSACRRTSQAAVIVDAKLRAALAIGYNGPAVGEDDETACRETAGSCGCVHAEANALIKLRGSESGLILACTESPCEACAKLILNSDRISRVAWLAEYRDVAGVAVLWAARTRISVGRLANHQLAGYGFVPVIDVDLNSEEPLTKVLYDWSR